MMRQRARIWIRVFSAAAVTGAAAAAYALAAGNEPALAAGLVIFVLSALFIPVMVKRVAVERKLAEGTGLLADWEYSSDEAAMIAAGLRFGKRAALRLPCRTRIARNCLFIANRCHPLNDYSRLSAEHARLIPAAGGMAILRMRYSYWAGRRYSRHEKDIDIPVPLGREREAQAIADTLGK